MASPTDRELYEIAAAAYDLLINLKVSGLADLNLPVPDMGHCCSKFLPAASQDICMEQEPRRITGITSPIRMKVRLLRTV